MKVQKGVAKKEKNIGTPVAKVVKAKTLKNKKGNPPGSNLNPQKAQLALKSEPGSFIVKDGKSPKKKKEMKSKVFNGKASPNSNKKPVKVANSPGDSPKMNRKRKSDEGASNTANSPQKTNDLPKNKKIKKNKGESAEVQLGLKIEKLLESPKNRHEEAKAVSPSQPGTGPSKKKNKKKRKNSSASEGNSPTSPGKSVTPSPNKEDGSPSKNAQKKKKRNKKKKASLTASPVVQNQPGKNKKDAPVKVDHDAPIKIGDFPSRINVENAIKALLAHHKQRKESKTSLLNEHEVFLVSVNFFKASSGKRLQRILLPNLHIDPNSDIIFISTDLRKAKVDPEESLDFHKELFKTHGVSNISEIIPFRTLSKEYTQLEEKKKLANRADVFLIDSKLSHRWPALMRKKTMKRKAPIPVRLEPHETIKKNIEVALRKIPVILEANTLTLVLNFGNSKMPLKALVDNVMTIGTALCDTSKFPEGRANIRQIDVKTAKSPAFPIHVSRETPNSVKKLKPQSKKQEVVVGEVTTAGATVAVHPSGHVKILSKDVNEKDVVPKKPVKEESDDEEEEKDDSDADEEDDSDADDDIDPELLKKFTKANKASDEESSDEEEIEKAEQEFLLELRKQQDALEAEAKAANEGKAKQNPKKNGKPAKSAEAGSSEEDGDSEELLDDSDLGDDLEFDDVDEEDDDEEEDDESDVPDLVPSKSFKELAAANKSAGKPKAGKGGKPVQGGGKPFTNALQNKGKPKNSPKAKKQDQRPSKGKPSNIAPQQKPQQQGKPGNLTQQKGKPGHLAQQKGKPKHHQQQGKPGGSPKHKKGGAPGGKGSPNSNKGNAKQRYFNMKPGNKAK